VIGSRDCACLSIGLQLAEKCLRLEICDRDPELISGTAPTPPPRGDVPADGLDPVFEAGRTLLPPPFLPVLGYDVRGPHHTVPYGGGVWKEGVDGGMGRSVSR
jgi:hypothetical protein